MVPGLCCHPLALCFTTSPSQLKNCLYRSFIAGFGGGVGGGGLNYFPVPFHLTACVCHSSERRWCCCFSFSAASPLFSQPIPIGSKSYRPPDDEHLLGPLAKQSPVFTVSIYVFTSPNGQEENHSCCAFSLTSVFQEILTLCSAQRGDAFEGLTSFLRPLFSTRVVMLVRSSESSSVSLQFPSLRARRA